MRQIVKLTVLAGLLVALAAGAPSLASQLEQEAGFLPIEESVSYVHAGSYFNRIPLRTSPARLWYVFQPADADAAVKPLFVFFNGGPGGATSCGLFASTAKLAVVRDEVTGEAAIAANPASWTALGNLLYLDSRTTGFSYSLMDDPGDDTLRGREFDAQNYSPFVDGADFVRALLGFLAAHPSIRGNRIVLVPESYGGIRTTVMLNLLLYYGRYADGSAVFQDPGLAVAIRAHYDAVFPGHAGRTVPPAVIAGQFGHQVLIQTALSWSYQRRVAARLLEEPGSPLYRVAAETGIPYVLYRNSPDALANPTPGQVISYIHGWLDSVGRDAYHMAKPAYFFDGHKAAAEGFLTRVGTLNLLTGVDVTAMPEMYASARGDAYKTRAAGFASGGFRGAKAAAVRPRPDFSALVGPPPDRKKLAAWHSLAAETDLVAAFGLIEPWDRYFLGLNYDVSQAFADNKLTLQGYQIQYNNSAVYGRLFLENAAWVETFATDAAWDSVVYSPAVPEALALHADILSAARFDAAGPPGAARPGRILLAYRPSVVAGSSVTERTIRFPGYRHSGHAVTMTEARPMLDDLVEWLAETGLPVKGR